MPSYFLEHLPNTPEKERNFITDYYEKASSSKVKNILINRNVQISRGKQTACP